MARWDPPQLAYPKEFETIGLGEVVFGGPLPRLYGDHRQINHKVEAQVSIRDDLQRAEKRH